MRRVALFIVALALLGAVALAQTPVPASPARWATDTAGFLSPSALQAVDRQLEDFERTSGNQVLVWIGTTTGGVPLEDWTIKAFERWKVGRKGLDNGVVLFVFATDRRARIEVGYGLEDKVPDIIASRILNDVVIPRIKTGDQDGAVLQGVAALTAAVAGTPQAAPGQAEAERPVPEWARPTEPPTGLQIGDGEGHRLAKPQMSVAQMLVIGILGLAFLILLITNPQLAIYLLINILASGRSGGGGSSSGGGGFSGGGGRGGGGGASGSW
jgi:uncharacterized protein